MTHTDTLPRLEDVTTEYLDNISRRLQHDTFSETAKQSYDEAWRQHYAQLEIAAIMFHDDGNDITLIHKECDSRMRNLEYRLDDIARYADRVKLDLNRHVVNDPEITVLEHDRLEERLDRLRSQYAYVRNMLSVWHETIRPSIEKRTGYTMGAYKSRKQIEYDQKAKKYRAYRKRLTMSEWGRMSISEREDYINQCTVRLD